MNEPEIKNFIKVPCESCGNERFVTVCDRKDGFVISRCEECHLEFVNPLPTIEFLNQLFNKEMTGIGYHGSYFEEYFKERSRRGKSYGKIYQSQLPSTSSSAKSLRGWRIKLYLHSKQNQPVFMRFTTTKSAFLPAAIWGWRKFDMTIWPSLVPRNCFFIAVAFPRVSETCPKPCR